MATAKSRSIMGKEQWEKYFREQLNNHEIQVDTQEIWDHVEGALPPRSNHVKYGIFGFLLLAMLIGAWVLWPQDDMIHVHGESIDQVSSINENKSTNQLSIAGKESNYQNGTDFQSTSSASTKFNAKQNGSSEEKINSVIIKDNPMEDHPIAEHSDHLKDISDGHKIMERDDPNRSNGVDSNEGEEAIIDVRFTSGNTNAYFASTKRPNNKDQPNTLSFDGEIHAIVGQPKVLAPDGLTPEMNQATVNRWLESTKEERITMDALIKTPALQIAPLSEETIDISRYKNKGLSDCYNFSGKAWAWSFDVYAGLNYAAKQLKENSQTIETKDYISARKNSESYLEAFEAGLAVNLMHRKGYLISSGINYGQINEKFNFFSVKTSTMFDSVVVRINVDSTGMRDTTKEWRPVTVQTTKEILTYNSYRTVDIPISIGYQFYKGKWLYEFQGGVMFNLAFKQKGEILDEQLNVSEIGSGKTFKNGLGISVFGGFKAIYPVNEHLGLFVEPVVRFNVKPITVGGYALEQRYNQFGLRLGARMSL